MSQQDQYQELKHKLGSAIVHYVNWTQTLALAAPRGGLVAELALSETDRALQRVIDLSVSVAIQQGMA